MKKILILAALPLAISTANADVWEKLEKSISNCKSEAATVAVGYYGHKDGMSFVAVREELFAEMTNIGNSPIGKPGLIKNITELLKQGYFLKTNSQYTIADDQAWTYNYCMTHS